MMKSLSLAITATAIIAFAIGWVAKPAGLPAPEEGPAVVVARPRERVSPAPVAPARDWETPDPAAGTPVAPETPGPVPGPLSGDIAEHFTKIRQLRDEAKWQRLNEVLELSDAQQEKLREVLASLGGAGEAPSGFQDPSQAAAELSKMGATLDAGLADVLTPAQRGAFDGMLRLEQENRIEALAHRELAELIATIDLSEDQREDVARRLREVAGAQARTLPRELELMVDSSVLPLGPLGVNRSTLEAMRGSAGTGSGDFRDQRLREMADRQELLKGILTPAQAARHQTMIEEQQVILRQIGPSR
jgi:hypothetical protein